MLINRTNPYYIEEHKVLKERDITSPNNIRIRRQLKTIKIGNQNNFDKISERLKLMGKEINSFASPRKSLVHKAKESNYDAISNKIGKLYFLRFHTLVYLLSYLKL